MAHATLEQQVYFDCLLGPFWKSIQSVVECSALQMSTIVWAQVLKGSQAPVIEHVHQISEAVCEAFL